MKKLISILICAALVLSLIPAVSLAGAEGAKQEFVVADVFAFNSYRNAGTVTKDVENGYVSVTDLQTRYYHMLNTGTSSKVCGFVVFRLNILNSGEYNVQLKTNNPTTISAAPEIYLVADDGTITRGTSTLSKAGLVGENSPIGYFDFSEAKKDSYSSVTDLNGAEASVTVPASGNYFLVLSPNTQSRALSSGTTDGDLIEKGIVNSSTGDLLGDNVDSGTHLQEYHLSGIKLVPVPEEPEDAPAGGTVSFAQTTNIDGFEDIAIESVNRGEAVELTAHKQSIPGYKFIGWKRGADTSDENSWVDIEGDTYKVWSNTYLTAVYEKEDEKNVAFWNQNGAYIGSMTESVYNAQTALFTPKLTGFGTFLGWFTDGNVEFTAKQTLAAGTTNAVAQYTASAITGVKHNGTAVADAGAYNAPVELNKDSEATAWLRDGEIIAYGKTYKFNVWDATNITEGTEEISDRVPVAILDYSESHKAYMLEYDAGDYEIVEAGIIFGKDTIDVKTYTSQRKEKHNQFTVPEEGTLEATGYIIYTLDNGASYKTKYVSVKTEE